MKHISLESLYSKLSNGIPCPASNSIDIDLFSFEVKLSVSCIERTTKELQDSFFRNHQIIKAKYKRISRYTHR